MRQCIHSHHSVRQISRETGSSQPSVFRDIHKDLGLEYLKMRCAQKLTESRRVMWNCSWFEIHGTAPNWFRYCMQHIVHSASGIHVISAWLFLGPIIYNICDICAETANLF